MSVACNEHTSVSDCIIQKHAHYTLLLYSTYFSWTVVHEAYKHTLLVKLNHSFLSHHCYSSTVLNCNCLGDAQFRGQTVQYGEGSCIRGSMLLAMPAIVFNKLFLMIAVSILMCTVIPCVNTFQYMPSAFSKFLDTGH